MPVRAQGGGEKRLLEDGNVLMLSAPSYCAPVAAALPSAAWHAGAVAGSVVGAAVATLGWGTFAVGSGLFIPVTQRVKISHAVALSFDDGPSEEFTPRLLDLLGEHQAQASFFLIGRYVAKSAKLVRRMVDEGHTVGNHTWDHHRDGLLGGRDYWDQQIRLGEEAIGDAIGRRPRLFRPPLGFKTATQAGVLRHRGYEVIGWRLRAFDTLPLSAAAIAQRVVTHVRPGDIVTLHDGLEPQRWNKSQAHTCQAMADILTDLRQRGLRCVSLETGLQRSSYRD